MRPRRAPLTLHSDGAPRQWNTLRLTSLPPAIGRDCRMLLLPRKGALNPQLLA